MQRRIVPDVVNRQDLCVLPANAIVREAAQLMAQRRIGAILIMEGDKLTGIFTERDVATRIVAAGLDPDKIKLGQVMTPNPDTLAPSDTTDDALHKMRTRGYRHLPVVEGGRVIAIVSVRDLYGAMIQGLEDEINDRDAFIHGRGYGAAR